MKRIRRSLWTGTEWFSGYDIYKVYRISKKAYFLKKKHGKDKPEVNNIHYLHMVAWSRMKRIKEESTLPCTYQNSFDFKTLLMFYVFKSEIKSTSMRRGKNRMQTETNTQHFELIARPLK